MKKPSMSHSVTLPMLLAQCLMMGFFSPLNKIIFHMSCKIFFNSSTQKAISKDTRNTIHTNPFTFNKGVT